MSAALHTRFTASLLLALFLSFTAARGFFYHTHIEGRMLISHSHPFSDSTHHHSAAQLISIDTLCSAAMTDDSAPESLADHYELSALLASAVIPNAPVDGYSFSRLGRAPPCM